jgi:putative DNA primase/helicase
VRGAACIRAMRAGDALMADLVHLFGGPFIATDPTTPEDQLIQAMRDAGLKPPDTVHLDGQLHRFATGTKGQGKYGGPADKPGWYVAFGDGIPAGSFGCWRSGVEMSWRADMGGEVSVADEMAIARRMSEARKARDEYRKKQAHTGAEICERIWVDAARASADHPYLARKKIAGHGARVSGDGRLIVPLYAPDGMISSLQYIEHDGTKRYHAGASTGGCYWMIGTMETPGVLYIAEGYATAATIHEVTGRPCAVAYSASNLPSVAGSLREKHGDTQDIVIVADHDAHGVGQKYADQAAAKHGVRVVMPAVEGQDANDLHLSGGDLLGLLEPPKPTWLVNAKDFAAKPAPLKWLVKRWLQDRALVMMHGPSGVGKSFLAIDWCMRIASGIDEWNGQRVRHGAVVYLAGEGHHGLKARIAGWSQAMGVTDVDMWISQSGCDLNTPAGYRQALESIKQVPGDVVLVVVDTLHRFLAGDENSSVDTKSMLDHCDKLMRELECTVLLVHHTGVSDEAQHRARGSSAWRGALDGEIGVTIASKDTGVLAVRQHKVKDAETMEQVYMELQQVPVAGWLDDDGEQVTTAIVTPTDAPTPSQKRDSALSRHRKTFERAWFASECETRGNSPYVSRSALIELLESDGMSHKVASNYARVAYERGTVGVLISAGYIKPHEHGWVICSESDATALVLSRGLR